MITRRFRVFGTKKDLENVFNEFQKNYTIKYYKCGINNGNEIQDITKIDMFGMSISGSHIGNQYLVMDSDAIVKFDEHNYLYQVRNKTSIVIDIGGSYDENTILPTEISTMWYDDENSKKIYNDLKKIIKKHSPNTVNGYMILEDAYKEKTQLRFATISVNSPIKYDLKI